MTCIRALWDLLNGEELACLHVTLQSTVQGLAGLQPYLFLPKYFLCGLQNGFCKTRCSAMLFASGCLHQPVKICKTGNRVQEAYSVDDISIINQAGPACDAACKEVPDMVTIFTTFGN